MSPLRSSLAIIITSFFSSIAAAETDVLASGWTLNPDTSSLNFVSVKKGAVMEQSKFATMRGEIDSEGNVVLRVLLDSVETGIDLRNVRMRFLLFETFLHSEAVITSRISPEMIETLAKGQVSELALPFSLNLHGVTVDKVVDVLVKVANDNTVWVSSIAPIVLDVADFNLQAGVEKLEEAAEVTITPKTAVSFNLILNRNVGSNPTIFEDAPLVAEVESSDRLSREACVGRFEILSRTRSVNFGSNSDILTQASLPTLQTLAGIIERCPEMLIEVAGHTDSIGPAIYNADLSQRRAESVLNYLVTLGISADQLIAKGYGETKPLVSNATEDQRQRNRRIAFELRS